MAGGVSFRAVVERWEHRVYWWDRWESWQGKRGAAGIRAMLAATGAAGWELVSVTETAETGYTFFFKRPMESRDRGQVTPESVPEDGQRSTAG